MVTRIVKTPEGRKTTRPTGEAEDSLRLLARQVGAAATDAALHVARLMQENVSKTAGGVMGLHGERMSRVDRAWLRMDSPSNLMMIVGFWILKPRVDYEAVCQRIRERMLKYPRFHQKVVEDATGASWVEDAGFDIYKHVVRERLPRVARGAEKAALQDLVGRLAVEPLDPSRPLWKMHLVENYRDEDGKPASVLIVRIHHCIADGIALIAVTMSLVDGGAEPPVRAPSQATESAEDWVAHNLVEPLAHIAVKALDAAGEGAAASLHLLREPGKGVSGSADLAKIAYHVLGDAAALALMTDDSKTRLKGKAGTAKRVAWCQPIPLDEVKAVGKALNCSVNDVLLSCVAGAIGEYLKAKGDSVKGKEIRSMIPVNLRPIQDAWKLGNHFGLAPLVLPIGIDNPIERVYEVRRRMQGLKGGTQPLMAYGLLAVAGMLAKPAQDAMLNLFSKKTTAVMTNVPGPREKLKFCGATLEQSLAWVPQSGDVGLGVSILSYGGGVQFGVITDTKLCPDPQAIIDEFEPEFAKLSMVTLMLPWGD